MQISLELSYLAIIISVVLTVIGQLLVKKGSEQVKMNYYKPVQSIKLVLKNNHLLLGMGITILAPLAYFVALVNIPLSVAFSLNSINYVLVSIVGYFIWKEDLSSKKIIGLVLIVGGTILIGYSL